MKNKTAAVLTVLLLTACAAPKPKPMLADHSATCMMAESWADEAKACRADAACIGSKEGAFNVEIWEGDVAAANKHFACGVR